MIGAFLRWARLVAPRTGAVWLLLAIWAGHEMVYGLIGWQWGFGQLSERFFRGRDFAFLFAAAAYGSFRVQAFHPLLSPSYLKWLYLTPWTPAKPLPRGPLHLVLQDLLAVGLLVLLMLHRPTFALANVPLVFLLAYYGMLAISLWLGDLRWGSYLLVAWMGLVIWTAGTSAEAAAGLAAIVYPLAFLGIRRMLSGFPWSSESLALRSDMETRWQAFVAAQKGGGVQPSPNYSHWNLPWPYRLLHGNIQPEILRVSDRAAVALLAGWWMFVILSRLEPRAAAPIGLMGYFLVLMASFFVRILIYCANHSTPISILGRIFTLRWIIPGYDRVFLTPLGTLATGCIVPAIFFQLKLEPVIILSLSLALVLMTALCGGPKLLDWQLTAPCRLAPGVRPQGFEEI